MKSHHLLSAILLLFANVDAVYAYGSSSSSNTCHKPTFSEFQPAANKYLQSFRAFSFVASSNTTASSIEVTVSTGKIKHHFTAKELEITPRRSGQLEVKGKLNRDFQHGFVRISASAHSKPDCKNSDGYLIRVQ
ncbi:hypothetical protein [Methylomonas sp. MgM2]